MKSPRGLSIGGLVGGVALDYGADKLKDSGHEKLGAAASIGSDTLTGASTGALIGSFVPVIGTAVGGAVGGAMGAAYGVAKEWKNIFKTEKKNQEKEEDLLDKQESWFSGLKDFGSKAWEKTKSVALDATKAVTEGADKAWTATKDTGSKAWEGAKSIAKDGVGWLSGMFESGGDYSNVSKDNIGYAMGKYQINTRTGKDQHEMLAKQFPELAEASKNGFESKEYQEAWKSLAKGDKKEAFQKAQEDAAMNGVNSRKAFSTAKELGLNVDNNATIQAAIFSSAQQYGGGGTKRILKQAFEGKDISSMSDEDQIKAIYQAKKDLIASNFTEKTNGANTDKVRRQQLDRIEKEQSVAVKANQEDLPPIVAAALGKGPNEAKTPYGVTKASSDEPSLLSKPKETSSTDKNVTTPAPNVVQHYHNTQVIQPAFQVSDPLTQAMSF
jgi:uncharacterized protein (DUF697 family)